MKTIKLFHPPWLELFIMLAAVIISFAGLSIISYLSGAPASGEMSVRTIVLWMVAFFLLSFAIAMVSVVAGIGGGVIFTPIMMAFTPVNSLIIRATGLIVAMSSGIISTGIFMKKGIGNFKMCVTLAVSQGIGALFGAQMAIMAASKFGDTGEGVIRIMLGIILVLVAVYFFVGGKKLEWPNIQKVDAVTKWMGLQHTYYEESDNKVYSYKIHRILLGLVFVFGVGFMGGFFGMGAGWAITPVQNLVLGVPLKVAAANSGIILGMVDCVAAWPYMLAGSIIPLFVLPWFSGHVVGGYLGAMVLVRARVMVVRFILIGIMVFTSFGLVTDGLAKLYLMAKIPGNISLIVFLGIMVLDAFLLFHQQRKDAGSIKNGK
ncbi:MAG: sulfite exporter TauE/SafE family protein [Treponema sp.]|nr:sulfite exporter TauE/SafE family protein [Treponema sp.]